MRGFAAALGRRIPPFAGSAAIASPSSEPFLEVVIVIPNVIANHSLPFESQNRRANAIEKITVVTDHDHAATESHERFFEQAQRAEIEIVGRFVENENVAAALKNFREQDPAPLAAAELIDLRVDAFLGEKETAEDIRAA